MNNLGLIEMSFLDTEIKWIIEALELRSTLYKAGSFSYEMNEELKQRFQKKIKEEQ